jgi:hypothetical protein
MSNDKELDRLLGKMDDEPEVELVDVFLDLAPVAGMMLMHNGVPYMHGGHYRVDPGVARDLEEMERRGHSHEAAIHEPETRGRRRMNTHANKAAFRGETGKIAASYSF